MDNENDKLTELVDDRNKKDSRYKISKKHVVGFIAGVIVTTILAFGSKLVTDSSELTGTAALHDEYTYEQNMPEVTNANFKAEVLESDQPVIVFYTATEASYVTAYMLYIVDNYFEGEILKYNVPKGTNYVEPPSDVPSNKSGEDLISYPLLVLYNKGKEIGRQSLVVDDGLIYKWVSSFVNPAISTLTPTPRPTPIPSTPTPVPLVPTVYRAFPSCLQGNLSEDPDNLCIGELIINAYDFTIEDTYLCQGDVQLPIKDHAGLYNLLGNTYGGDEEWFGIPDFSNEAPLDGMDYYLSTGGTYSTLHEYDAEIKIGDISYFPEEYPRNVAEYLLGQIILAKDMDETKYGKGLLPCDGREIKININNQALFALVGTKFGGDGKTTFKLPDMSMLQPIEGAKYYIVVEGLFPTRE